MIKFICSHNFNLQSLLAIQITGFAGKAFHHLVTQVPKQNLMSTPADSQAKLSILVKSPTDAPGTPDLPLDFPRTATVQDVKVALESAHPRQPSASSQRLIHAGKLLADSATLVDVLKGTAPQVVHLVTPPAAPTQAQSTPPPTQGAAQQTSITNSAAGHVQEVEEAFARVLHHQQEYLALVRATPPANPQAISEELARVRAAVANYDACVQRQRNPIEAGGDAVVGLGVRPQFVPGAGPENGLAPPADQQPWMVGGHQQQIGGGVAWVNGPQMFGVAGADGARQGQQVWRRAMVFQFDLHWGLLLKLGVFVFILAQEGSPRRTKMLLAVALMAYLWHTGHLGFVRRLLGVLLPSPVQLFSYLSASSQREMGARGRESARPVSASWRIMVFLSYVYSFLYGFVCSLLPSWNPEPLPQDVLVGRPQGAAHVHEHAE